MTQAGIFQGSWGAALKSAQSIGTKVTRLLMIGLFSFGARGRKREVRYSPISGRGVLTRGSSSPEMEESPQLCHFCNREGAKARCSRCKTVVFCGQDCQIASWKEHRKVCLPLDVLTSTIEWPPQTSVIFTKELNILGPDCVQVDLKCHLVDFVTRADYVVEVLAFPEKSNGGICKGSKNPGKKKGMQPQRDFVPIISVPGTELDSNYAVAKPEDSTSEVAAAPAVKLDESKLASIEIKRDCEPGSTQSFRVTGNFHQPFEGIPCITFVC